MSNLLFLLAMTSVKADENDFYFDKSFNFNYDYKHEKYWKDLPNVYVCEDADLGVDSLRIAINFWEEKGYVLNLQEEKVNCNDISTNQGIYFIKNSGLDLVNYFGETINFVYPNSDNLIYRSEVKINNKNNIHNHPEVIIHEIGHALGIEHHSSDQSVMYSKHFSHFSTF